MKNIYFFRVFFISYEFISSLSIISAFFLFKNTIEVYTNGAALNEKAIEWLTLVPAGIMLWIIKEGQNVIFPSESSTKVLHQWPNYWQLKIHFSVGLMFSIVYAALPIAVWASNNLNTYEGRGLLLCSFVGSSINAFSFYGANINIKELFAANTK